MVDIESIGAIYICILWYIYASEAIKVGCAAGERDKSKNENIFNNCHDAGIIVLPFVAETFGTWGKIAKYIISYISKRWADKHMENRDTYINWIY